MNKKEIKMTLIGLQLETKIRLERMRFDAERNEEEINRMLDRLNYIEQILKEIDNEN